MAVPPPGDSFEELAAQKERELTQLRLKQAQEATNAISSEKKDVLKRITYDLPYFSGEKKKRFGEGFTERARMHTQAGG